MLKIHYRNKHGGTNLPWQPAFKKYGELSLGSVNSGSFPKEIDHLHLGGSCKGVYSLCKNPITIEEIKEVQERTNCSVSCFFGDPVLKRFKFHHKLLDYVPKVKVYSAALYGTSMWRSDINWVLHPVDENIFQLVEHKINSTVLFVGTLTPYRKEVINKLLKVGIRVDVVGRSGNISLKFGRDLAEFSKNYIISIGIPYNGVRPKIRYSSTRLPNALAMGLIYIESDFDLKGVFEQDEIIQWKTIEELIQKIYYYIDNPDKGMEIIMKGRKKVLNNWTFTKLVQRFLKEGI